MCNYHMHPTLLPSILSVDSNFKVRIFTIIKVLDNINNPIPTHSLTHHTFLHAMEDASL